MLLRRAQKAVDFRPPDNLFGSNPTFEKGVDLATSGVNSDGKTIPLGPVALANCYDILHTHESFKVALALGADRSLASHPSHCTLPPNPQFKYVDNTTGTVQPYFDIAKSYGFSNRMFQTNQGPSFPAHQFIFGGTSAPTTLSPLFAAENLTVKHGRAGCIAPDRQRVDLIDQYGSELTHPATFPCYERPTLTDLMDAASPPISWRYYAPMPGSIWTAPDAIQHICQPKLVNAKLACTGPAWTNGSVVPHHPAKVLTDIAACSLQSVSWIIPTGQESDHAKINKGLGPQWVASIVNAIGTQPTCANNDNYWNDTAIIIT